MKRNNDLLYWATRLIARLAFLSMLAAESSSFGQGTAFTYQGRLIDNGSPGNTNYDFTFAVYDAGTGGSLVAGPITNSAVAVSAGLFTTTLDFGAGVFTGAPLWLEIGVAPGGNGTFHTLSPRQALTPAPYAIFAGSGPGGSGVWSLNGASAYYNAGNVGIGTSTPAEKLTIAGVGSFSTGLRLTGSASGGTGLSLENTGAGGHKFDLFSGGSGVSVGTGGFGIFDETAGAYRFAISSSGKVGIGTPTPAAGLDVYGEWDGVNGALTLHGTDPSLRLSGGLVEGSWLIQGSPDGLEFFTKQFIDPNFSMVMSLTPFGLGLGVTNPAENLTIGGVSTYNTGLKLTGSSSGGSGMAIECTASGGHKYAFFSAGSGDAVGAGGFGIYDDTAGAYRFAVKANGFVGIGKSNPTTMLDINGTTTTKVLTITGGADLAEPFQMSDAHLDEGSVVIIDEDNPGQLKLSTEPYDRRVAGIVSGANGVHPGISLQQTGTLEGGQNVALSGRVYVLADATYGAIKPGDLLTTSTTPGHAMRVTNHANSQGAILGKAMSSLKQGKGMVLVLVTLQ
jgi:hypothetical protein